MKGFHDLNTIQVWSVLAHKGISSPTHEFSIYFDEWLKDQRSILLNVKSCISLAVTNILVFSHFAHADHVFFFIFTEVEKKKGCLRVTPDSFLVDVCDVSLILLYNYLKITSLLICH